MRASAWRPSRYKASISSGANNSATLTLSGSQADINATLASLTYRGNANFNGSDSFTFQANDGAADSNVATVAVTVAGAPGFVLGVQWHPEWRVRESEVSMAIFRAFGDACRSYRT